MNTPKNTIPSCVHCKGREHGAPTDRPYMCEPCGWGFVTAHCFACETCAYPVLSRESREELRAKHGDVIAPHFDRFAIESTHSDGVCAGCGGRESVISALDGDASALRNLYANSESEERESVLEEIECVRLEEGEAIDVYLCIVDLMSVSEKATLLEMILNNAG